MAFIILTCCCCFYYNIPVDYPNQYGTTDFVCHPNTFYLWGKDEGYGWGSTNNEGFHEALDYQEGMPVDVLIMGSSQVQGYNVRQSKTMTAVLNAIMPDKTIYNIGISGHYFLTCCCNLEAALERYEPSEAVVIEIGAVDYTEDELMDAVTGRTPEMAGDYGGILEFLARNPFLRLFQKQLSNCIKLAAKKTTFPSETVDYDITESSRYVETLGTLFEKISELCKQKGTNLIILYHPETQLGADGTLFFDTDPDALRIFRDGCEAQGITFVDMTDSFKRLYEDEHRLPYGFINSRVGKGHFNADGHRLVAEELCAVTRSLESEKGR